jgi:hypothetical protein
LLEIFLKQNFKKISMWAGARVDPTINEKNDTFIIEVTY